MSRNDASLDAVLFDFHALVESDRESQIRRPLDEYLKRFPGYEAQIRAEFSWIDGDDAAFLAATGDASRSALDSATEKQLGPYRLLSEIGRGGQGSVWLAEDTRLARRVALKVLSASASFSAEGLRRFRREAETASRLDHPAICTIYETGYEQGAHYIAMKLVEGEPLSDKVDRARASRRSLRGAGEDPPCRPRNRLELERLLLFVEKVADALHTAHEAGIVHRDVKPGNIVVTPAGEPVVLDFGLAREAGAEESMTLTGDVVGTPTYMAPEQIGTRARELDRRVDVYALGVVLFECLVLERPHVARTREELLRAIVRDPPRDPRRFDADLPRDVVSVLEVALEKDRTRRYATTRALAEDLARIRRDEPILARPPSRAVRAARWVRRHRIPVTVSSVALALVALGGFGWWKAHSAGADRQLAEGRATRAEATLDDGRFAVALLELTSEPPSDGPVDDWKLAVERTFRLLEAQGLPVRDLDRGEAFDAAFEPLAARNAKLASKVLDTLYDAWIELDLVARGELARDVSSAGDATRSNDELAGLGGRRASAARAREEFERDDWECVRNGLDRLLARVDRDTWRRKLFALLQRVPDEGPGALEALLAPDVLAGCSIEDRQRLCAFLFHSDAVFAAQYLLDGLVDATPPDASDRFATFVARGWLSARFGLVDQAMRDLERALAIRADSASTATGLAQLCLRQERWTEARRHAEQAVRADPRDANAHYALAYALLGSGDALGAERAATVACDLWPEAGRPLVVRGKARLELGRDAEGLLDLAESVELSPELVLPLNRELGLLRARIQPEPRLELVADLVREMPASPFLAAIHGTFLLDVGRNAAALGELERAARGRPHDVEILLRLGWIQGVLGRFDQVLVSQAEVLRLLPGHPEATKNLADALCALGRHAEAAPWLDELWAKHPSEGRFQEAFVDLYLGQGDRVSAEFVLDGLLAAAASDAVRLNALALVCGRRSFDLLGWRAFVDAARADAHLLWSWVWLFKIAGTQWSEPTWRARITRDVDALVGENPFHGPALLLRARLFQLAEDETQALVGARAAAYAEDAPPMAHAYLAYLCLRQGLRGECDREIACVEDLAPDDQDLLKQVAGLKRKR